MTPILFEDFSDVDKFVFGVEVGFPRSNVINYFPIDAKRFQNLPRNGDEDGLWLVGFLDVVVKRFCPIEGGGLLFELRTLCSVLVFGRSSVDAWYTAALKFAKALSGTVDCNAHIFVDVFFF